jgi:tRNA A-37 threonylcarbamoyl transferase component Bud32/tetratricopeptide (TPR) repeat protein
MRVTPSVALPERFEILTHVANGGMASVWAAEDRVLGRRVAVKLLAEQFVGDAQAKVRFMREARAAAALASHPHVVTIFDVGEHEGRPYIVMEHLAGGSVADAVRDGRAVPPDRAVAWLRAAASALDAAHERGVVHRDVKPSNLLLDEHGRPAVADFGIARVALEDPLTATGQILGTASYTSPEQVRGEPATAASDLYSLGIVAQRLLTGRRPFVADNFVAQARAHVDEDPLRASVVEPRLPAAVDGVILRALAKDPAARWPSGAAFVDALERALGSGEATAATRAFAAAPPARRRGRRLALMALGGLALAAGAVALLAGGGERPAARSTPAATGGKRAPTAAAARSRPAQTRTASAPAAAPASAPPAVPADDPATLNDRGFALMKQGRYGEAIAPLQRAVDGACGPGAGLTCAYALYNLGRSLRLSGRPAEAIPILQRRLQFADQRGAVQLELDQARRAAGIAPPQPAPPAPGAKHKRGNGHGKHGQGGEGG